MFSFMREPTDEAEAPAAQDAEAPQRETEPSRDVEPPKETEPPKDAEAPQRETEASKEEIPILEDITEDDGEKTGLLRSIFGTRKPRTSPARKADPILSEAAHLVVERGRCSVVLLQRRLEIGYTRASRLVETLEAEGLVGPLLESGSREIRMTVEEWEASS